MAGDVLAVTGHRPDKLGGFGLATRARVLRLAMDSLVRIQPSRVISGMALGWDQAIAEAAIHLHIPLWAAVPFEGQECMWPAKAQANYRYVLSRSERVVVSSTGGFSNRKMQLRNEWMVRHCTRLLALWNGTPGGTANCLSFAAGLLQADQIENVWTQFAAAAREDST